MSNPPPDPRSPGGSHEGSGGGSGQESPWQGKAKGRSREAIKGIGMLLNKRGSMDVDSHVHCLPVWCGHIYIACNEEYSIW